MQIKFTFDKKDYDLYHKDILKIKRFLFLIFKTYLLANIILGLVYGFIFTDAFFVGGNTISYLLQFNLFVWLVFIVATVISFVLCNLFFLFLSYVAGGKQIAKYSEGLSPDVTINLEEDMISYSREGSNGTFEWKYVREIYNTKHNLLIFISDRQAIMLPKRVFETEEDIQNCWNLIQNAYDKSRS